jgi:NADH-quinone oxidoreductase subunit F
MKELRIKTKDDLITIKNEHNNLMSNYKYKILICSGAGCVSSDCYEVYTAVLEELKEQNIMESTLVVQTGCIGVCDIGPVILIYPEGIFYTKLTVADISPIITSHLLKGEIRLQNTYKDKSTGKHIPYINDIPYFTKQIKIALRNCGKIDFNSIEEYIVNDGYFAIAKALEEYNPSQLVEEIKKSGLRGRGGGGFPTGIKLEAGLNAKGEDKYIVCNADEGDPGAFMDRSILEGDPHSVIEGMMIAGYAIGASKGYIYVRAEYPLAIERLENAVNRAREVGILGKNIFQKSFDFDIEIRIGAGAFVCGEETALMESVEGQRGEPRQKPPFPFQQGLYGKPTIINNVETLANISAIVLQGSDWFSGYGTKKNKGTKVFALAGDINNTGIVEVPMGVSLGDIIYDIGGGIC